MPITNGAEWLSGTNGADAAWVKVIRAASDVDLTQTGGFAITGPFRDMAAPVQLAPGQFMVVAAKNDGGPYTVKLVECRHNGAIAIIPTLTVNTGYRLATPPEGVAIASRGRNSEFYRIAAYCKWRFEMFASELAVIEGDAPATPGPFHVASEAAQVGKPWNNGMPYDPVDDDDWPTEPETDPSPSDVDEDFGNEPEAPPALLPDDWAGYPDEDAAYGAMKLSRKRKRKTEPLKEPRPPTAVARPAHRQPPGVPAAMPPRRRRIDRDLLRRAEEEEKDRG